jgi:phage-related protein
MMIWTVETLNRTIDQELAALPADFRARFARFARFAELIEAVGLPHVGEPHVRHIQGALWEIRLKGKSGIARAFYVTASPERVVVLRVFPKKTQKTLNREIRLALQRAKELEQ